MKQALVYLNDILAAKLIEDDLGYEFRYDTDYLHRNDAQPVSLTLPLTDKPYREKVLFPFFDGLIPEGWLLDIAEQKWNISGRDRFAMLLACCKDCIGNVSVLPLEREEDHNV